MKLITSTLPLNYMVNVNASQFRLCKADNPGTEALRRNAEGPVDVLLLNGKYKWI